MTSWTISVMEAGQRLDLFLVERLKDKSRSMIQKAIKSGQITVNKKVAMVHRFLKEKDVIEVGEGEQNQKSKIKNQKFEGETKMAGNTPTPTVIEETADWIVIDKPVGLLVHADSVHNEPTLVDWILARDPEVAKVGEDPVRPGIIHRLDREVSGLMIIAKTQAAYDAFRVQFRDRVIKKRYLAMVHGVIARDEGEIKFRIARSATSARMAARPTNEEEGRAAWTHYHVIERFKGATLVELDIMSGRTHQIRAHLHALGRPIMGDTLYVLKKTDRNVTPPRLMLQSVSLSFQDPTSGVERSFALEPDPAFAALSEEFRVS